MNNKSGISTHYYQNNYQNVLLNGKNSLNDENLNITL